MEYHLHPATSTLSGTSFDSLRETLGPYFHSLSRPAKRTKSPFQWNIRATSISGLTLIQAHCSDDCLLSYKGRGDSVGILIPLSGWLEVMIGGNIISTTPGQALLVSTPLSRRIWLHCEDEGNSLMSLIFSEPLISTRLSNPLKSTSSCDEGPLPMVMLPEGSGETLGVITKTMIDLMDEENELRNSEKTTNLLLESALNIIFEFIPEQQEHSTNTTPRYVKAAINFMHDNLHRPLTISDIAAASGVSIRTLQAGLRRHHQTTPLRYLRRIRIEAAHQELSSEKNRLSVGEVAMKWGFNHPGRFSSEYQKIYGRHPSETAKTAKTARLPKKNRPIPG